MRARAISHRQLSAHMGIVSMRGIQLTPSLPKIVATTFNTSASLAAGTFLL